jgi:Tol biopolymer transport system component
MMPGSPRWLPDSTGVVFDASSPVSGVNVYTVSAEGGTPRQVTSLPGEESAPSVSRDGRSVYYSSQGVLFKAPLAGGQPIRVAEGIERDGQESFDGRWVYYVRANDLWRKPIGSGTEERFQSNVPSNGWALTAKEVFVLRPAGQTPGSIVAYDLETRRERLVRELSRDLRLFSATWLDVTQDGTAALISPIVRDESDIVLVDGIR